VTPESAVAQSEPERRAPVPPEPSTIEDTGLGYEALRQLLTKALFAGETSGLALSEKLCLPYAMLEALLEHLRVEKLIEVRGAAGSGTAGFRYALTDLGRERAQTYLEANGYIGPAPVPLHQYAAAMQKLKDERGFLTKERIAHGFTHLVVSPETLDQLGPAVNSGKSIFLYGPPGNGKTVVAEGIGRALGGDMYVPWALDIDGQIITIFDPVNHVRLEDEAPRGSIIRAAARDRRWVRIRRPVVTVGGELTLEMLDLSFNAIAKFYEAPLQLKANGGVFVVDDFGRQRIRPRDLLNRWIVPLESRVDFLTLHTGKKFEMPFDVLIVFATNLNPESLADEAFLRRIPYKIYAKNPTSEEFTKIFALNCKRQNVPFDPVVIEYLQRRYYEPRGLDMRACHPRDLVAQVVDMCRYQNKPPQITRELLDHACRNYFLEEQAGKQKARLRTGADGRAARVPPAAQKPAPGANGAEKRPAKEEWLS
jgi:predicted ATPase with chaperone activity